MSFEELAAWRAGELSAEEEARLVRRLDQDPQGREKLAALESVDDMFAKPPALDGPTDMPDDVAARLQMLLAREALRRSEEGTTGVSDGGDERDTP